MLLVNKSYYIFSVWQLGVRLGSYLQLYQVPIFYHMLVRVNSGSFSPFSFYSKVTSVRQFRQLQCKRSLQFQRAEFFLVVCPHIIATHFRGRQYKSHNWKSSAPERQMNAQGSWKNISLYLQREVNKVVVLFSSQVSSFVLG